MCAQQLRDGKDQIRCGDSGIELPRQSHPDHSRDGHVIGLAKHDRLGLNPPDPPAKNPDAIDHRSVGVKPDHGVGISQKTCLSLVSNDNPAQMFQIDLMADS